MTVSLRDVIGQDRALRMLLGARQRGRLATSYLFAGEQGIGKKFTALNFAKALNCRNPVSMEHGFTDACDACPSCKKTDAGTHPDVALVEPDGAEIKVDDIRRLEESLSLKSFEGGMKVAIVDEAQSMNANAANAFLKTLEEPPAGSLLILVSSSPDMLPETIRSRSARINFSPLGPEACEAVMRKFAGEKDDVPLLVRLSMGRPGLAAGEDLRGLRDRCRESMAGAEGKHPWKDRQDMERWLETWMLILRDMAAIKIAGGPEGLVNGDIAREIAALSEKPTLKGIIDCYGKLMELKRRLGFNLNKAITWNYAMSVLEELRGDV